MKDTEIKPLILNAVRDVCEGDKQMERLVTGVLQESLIQQYYNTPDWDKTFKGLYKNLILQCFKTSDDNGQ